MALATEAEQREAAAIACPTLLARLVRFERIKRKRIKRLEERRRSMHDATLRRIRRQIWEELIAEWMEDR